MFADDGGFDRSAGARPRPSGAKEEISTELLEDCRDSIRRAQRLTKGLGLGVSAHQHAEREERLAWAINAIEADARDPR